MVSGMPSVVNMDDNNICNIILENCALYDVTLKWDDIQPGIEILMVCGNAFWKSSMEVDMVRRLTSVVVLAMYKKRLFPR
jgi:hypothetical protein